MLETKIKSEIVLALKNKNDVRKNILRLVMGEVQTLNARNGNPKNDEESDRRYKGVITKILNSNKETLPQLSPADSRRVALTEEIVYLDDLLPKDSSTEDIKQVLILNSVVIEDAKSDGQATGVAMKLLKQKGLQASGEVVSKLVRELRASVVRN